MSENQVLGGGSAQGPVTDDDRQRVAERLTEAVGQGQLTLHEFAQRVDAAYGANTQAELDAATADLPEQEEEAAAAPAVKTDEKRRWKLAIAGGAHLRGQWRVPTRSGFLAFLGGSKIDLSEAKLETSELDITLVSVLGGNKVLVPRGVRVEVEDTDILGGTKVVVDEEAVPANSPVVRLRSYSILGGNKVIHPETGKTTEA